MRPEARVARFVRGGVRAIVIEVPRAAPSAHALSAAERAVAELAGRGLTNAEIAGRRGVSERTIANQLASAFRKTAARSRADLTRLLTGAR